MGTKHRQLLPEELSSAYLGTWLSFSRDSFWASCSWKPSFSLKERTQMSQLVLGGQNVEPNSQTCQTFNIISKLKMEAYQISKLALNFLFTRAAEIRQKLLSPNFQSHKLSFTLSMVFLFFFFNKKDFHLTICCFSVVLLKTEYFKCQQKIVQCPCNRLIS